MPESTEPTQRTCFHSVEQRKEGDCLHVIQREGTQTVLDPLHNFTD